MDVRDLMFSYLLGNSEEPVLETAFANQPPHKSHSRTPQTTKAVHNIPLRMLEEAYGVPFMHPTRDISTLK